MEPSSRSRHQAHGSPMTVIRICLLLLFVLQSGSRPALSASQYLVGMGSYDITGPAADVNMMGYANAEQIASGIHFRLKARAFIVAEPGGGGKRAVFVNLDACMASQLVTIKVLERLEVWIKVKIRVDRKAVPLIQSEAKLFIQSLFLPHPSVQII